MSDDLPSAYSDSDFEEVPVSGSLFAVMEGCAGRGWETLSVWTLRESAETEKNKLEKAFGRSGWFYEVQELPPLNTSSMK